MVLSYPGSSFAHAAAFRGYDLVFGSVDRRSAGALAPHGPRELYAGGADTMLRRLPGVLMAVYGIFTYDISDPEGYAAYSPGSLSIIAATMAKHGGEALFADSAARVRGRREEGGGGGGQVPVR